MRKRSIEQSPVRARILALVAVIFVGGCGRLNFDAISADAPVENPDSASGAPIARLVSYAFFSDSSSPTVGTQGVDHNGFRLDAPGISDGELLLVFACVDNGSDAVWPSPFAPGFTQLWQKYWGNDGQTCTVNWKIAASEPATYLGTYGSGINSASSILALVAITGAAGITDSVFAVGSGVGANPVNAHSVGVTTIVPSSLVVYATGSDWQAYENTVDTFTVPSGFTTLFALGDRGDATMDWTSLQIATRAVPQPIIVGPLDSTEASTGTSNRLATPFTAALAISPH